MKTKVPTKNDVVVTKLPNRFGTFDFKITPQDHRPYDFQFSESEAMALAEKLAQASGGEVIDQTRK